MQKNPKKEEDTSMKRMISLFFALVFVLSAVYCAASAEETFTTPYFTMTLPNGWIIDTTEADKAVDEDGMQDLGIVYEDKDVALVVEAGLILYDEWKDFSLWNASEAEVQDYVDTVMEDFADDDPTCLGIVKAGQIPFVLIHGTDEDGEYLYADTMTNGYAVILYAYVEDERENLRPLTERYIELFKSILATFQPVS